VSLTREEVIRYLEALPAEDLGKLADEVLARLGMLPDPEPAPRWVMVGVPSEESEDTALDVVLHACGADKLAVIAVVRRFLPMGLSEVKALVESAPVVVGRGLSRGDAEEVAHALRRAGAKAEVR
jgi:large subunit ribosomal protein L7/L12